MIVDLNSSKSFKPLTLDTFKTFIHDMYKDRPLDRTYTVLTGQGGMDMINFQMRIEGLKIKLEGLEYSGRVNKEQSIRLLEMINSPDRENLTVAELIMENI